MNTNNFEEFMQEWVNAEVTPTHIFSVGISEQDNRNELFSATINKGGKHSDHIAFTVCIGNIEGIVPHMHIFRGHVLNPSAKWKLESIRLQFKKAQYFEKLKPEKLTNKEIKILVKGLKSKYEHTDHTVWDELIYQWNNQTGKKKGDEAGGWLESGIKMPDYEAGISLYK